MVNNNHLQIHRNIQPADKGSIFLRRRPLAVAVAMALSLSMANAQAANIWVDSSGDALADDGVCTLREAIENANSDSQNGRTAVGECEAGSGADFIRLLDIAGSTITLSGARLPTVTSDVTIQGESVTIDAAGNSGLMDVSGSSLTISRLSLVNGSANGPGDHTGGGIRVRNGASLTLQESTISNSTAASNGGGISVESGGENVIITDSTLSNNSALGTVADTYGSGGGIFLAPPVSGDISLVLRNSTLSGNTASATGFGGGLYTYGGPATGNAVVAIVNSTLVGNTAGTTGGAIYTESAITVLNSIIANPGTASCAGSGGLYGHPLSVSLVQGGGCTIGPGTLLTGDPLLGPLADNGGPTKTHAPMSGSPVIDAVTRSCFDFWYLDEPNPLVPDFLVVDSTSDQRGYERTDDQCDPGAFEVGGAALQAGPEFVVDSAQDEFAETDPLPGDGRRLRRLTGDGHCNVAPGDCTLRDAVSEANVSADASMISMAASLNEPFLDMKGVEPLLVTSDLTIQGSGKTARMIVEVASFEMSTRLFTVDSASLNIDRLNLNRGEALSGSGGAILVREHATLGLANSTLFGNRASLYGGAIAAEPGASLTLADSIIDNNVAGLQGGGIHLAGTAQSGVTLSISNSDIVSNKTSLGCEPTLTTRCAGGGIFIDFGTADLVDSNISGNRARGSEFEQDRTFGGGMYSANSGVTLTRSTLAENESTGYGGGLSLKDSDVTLTNSTVSGNSQTITGGAILMEADGTTRLVNSTIFANGNEFSSGIGGIVGTVGTGLELTNSIISNSVGPDCVAGVTASGVNLIGDGLGCGSLAPGPNLLTGDPMLGPLADNGGATQTHLPRVASPVINAVPADACTDNGTATGASIDIDQRGQPRPSMANCDIGAVEVQNTIFGDGFEPAPISATFSAKHQDSHDSD